LAWRQYFAFPAIRTQLTAKADSPQNKIKIDHPERTGLTPPASSDSGTTTTTKRHGHTVAFPRKRRNHHMTESTFPRKRGRTRDVR